MTSPYVKLQDASSLLFLDGRTRVSSFELYLGWQAEHVRMRGIARVWNCDRAVKARVDHGRWIADCEYCRSGMFTHPEWRLACCAQCGAVYSGVEFPQEIAEITRLLLLRPRIENQNWFPGDTVLKLKLANKVHGLPC